MLIAGNRCCDQFTFSGVAFFEDHDANTKVYVAAGCSVPTSKKKEEGKKEEGKKTTIPGTFGDIGQPVEIGIVFDIFTPACSGRPLRAGGAPCVDQSQATKLKYAGTVWEEVVTFTRNATAEW